MRKHRSTTPLSAALPEFHPEAPRPDFTWTVHLPSSWHLLETHPDLALESTATLANASLAHTTMEEQQRTLVLRHLEETITQAQNLRVLMAMVLPQWDKDEFQTGFVVLRWVDSFPMYASVSSTQQQLEAFDPKVKLTDAGGYFVALSRSYLGNDPAHPDRMHYSHQAFVPLPGTTWTLVVSGSAPTSSLSAIVEHMVQRIAASLRAYSDPKKDWTRFSPRQTQDGTFPIEVTWEGAYRL
ncbi:hypothetical protein [Corynebacterium felinum]|uniref:hypothetical protein n=1 Tax=Corynebacterium felinum TaxID=131318 RepID=UPI0025B3AA95|nr:hypothetical protein [Corynebacterium felinum]